MTMKKEDYDFLYKIILVGDPKVGKTSFLLRYTKNSIKNTVPTIGVEYATKCVLLKNGSGIVKAQIWDTSGSEKYKSITTAHYRRSVGALLFYDLTDDESYKNTTEWLKEIHEHTEEGIVVMMIGNKVDLVQENPSDRKIKIEEVKSFCQKYNLLYNETSAKNGDNIKESFEELIENIYQQSLKNPPQNEILEAQNKIVLVSSIGENKKDEKKENHPNTNQKNNSDCCK